MLREIGSITVHVSDLDRALEFYVDRLGLEKRSDNPMGPDLRWVTVAPPGARTEIILAHGFADDAGPALGKGTGFVFQTDDIEETYRTLSAQGVMFTEPPAMQPWGMKQALFVDQDNNGYVLVERS